MSAARLEDGSDRHAARREPERPDPQPEAGILALQHTAGNRAVATLLGPRDKRFFVELTRALTVEMIGTGASPLGQTEPEAHSWPVPVVDLQRDGDRWRFVPSPVLVKPDSRYHVPAVGDYDLGPGWKVTGTTISKDDISFSPLTAPLPDGEYHVHYRVTAATQAAIRADELQHVADFQRAFDLSCGLMSRALNTLQDERFANKDAAIRALARRLQALGSERGASHAARYLPPADPFELASWAPRIRHVADRLEACSYHGRDTTREHSPSGYTWEGGAEKLFVTPRIEVAGTQPETIVDYDTTFARDDAKLIPAYEGPSLLREDEPEDLPVEEPKKDEPDEPEPDPFAAPTVWGGSSAYKAKGSA